MCLINVWILRENQGMIIFKTWCFNQDTYIRILKCFQIIYYGYHSLFALIRQLFFFFFLYEECLCRRFDTRWSILDVLAIILWLCLAVALLAFKNLWPGFELELISQFYDFWRCKVFRAQKLSGTLSQVSMYSNHIMYMEIKLIRHF